MGKTFGTAISITGVIALVAIFAWLYLWISPASRLTPPSEVSIAKGESFRSVARRLKHAHVVRSSTVLLIYGELTGKARRIQPGDYEFKGAERIPDVMRHLVNGDFASIVVSIPEGLTVHQIAERFAIAGLVCQSDFERAAHDGALIRALGLQPLGAEGYLFPATYKFSPHASQRDVLTAMLTRFFQILTPRAEDRMFELGLSARELVTMASIVEKEAKIPGERKLIASVFYNRLKLECRFNLTPPLSIVSMERVNPRQPRCGFRPPSTLMHLRDFHPGQSQIRGSVRLRPRSIPRKRTTCILSRAMTAPMFFPNRSRSINERSPRCVEPFGMTIQPQPRNQRPLRCVIDKP